MNGLEVLGEYSLRYSGYFVISEFDTDGVDCSIY